MRKQTGNPGQWADSYPGEQLLREDIAGGSERLACRHTVPYSGQDRH
ncbi:MAG: hypothetical protein ACI3Y2_07115 [Candidatus Egerieousia sp.]